MALDLGDLYRCSYTNLSPAGAPATAGTMTLTITLPDGTAATPVVVVATAVFPMIINMHAGVRSVDPELLEMSTSFRASRWLNLRRVVIPSTAPVFSSGFRMAIALALIGEVVAEFFSANRGIGYQLNVASQVYNIKQVYAMMIILAVTGIVLASLARLLERRVERWHGTAR